MASSGQFTINDWIVTAEPESNVNITVLWTETSKTYKPANANNDDKYIAQIDIVLEMRACQLGEITVGNACELCPEQTYSLDPYQVKCSKCPEGATCLGDWTMVPDSGYWRSSKYSD